MRDIIQRINQKVINSYIEKNLDDFYTKCTEHSNFSSHIDDKISWILAKNSEWPDCIFRANFEHLKIGNEIKNIKYLIKKGKAPNGWTVGPLTKPQNLGELLLKNSFSNFYQQAGMALNLKELEQKHFYEDDLLIDVISTEEPLKRWGTIVSSVFKIKIDFELLRFLLGKKEAIFYIGYLKEKAVSTLLLYLSSGVAGLHAVSTLPEFRNKGYGLKISRRALMDASNMNYSVGVLQASSLGEKIYRKLGFNKFCDIMSYELKL